MSKYINLHNYAADEGAKKPSIASNTVKVFIVSIAVLLIGMVNSRTSTAAPFSLSFKNNLNFVCDPDNNVEKRSNLSQVCTNIIGDGPNVGSVFSSIPTGSSPQGAGMLSIEQRLQSPRESEEERLEGRKDRQIYALNSSERFAQSDGLHLPPTGGTAPNVAFGLGPGTSVFFSAGAYALEHYNNRFEDGYGATLPSAPIIESKTG
jgi:hypothetical protein